jgi:tetratricopeptide (TPR) repeat protein
VAQIDQAQRLEPQSQSILADKALILFAANRGEEAVALLRQLEAADPAYSSPHAYLAQIDLARGDYPAWLREARTGAALVHDPDQLSVVAAAERGWRAGGAPAMFAAMIERQRALYAAGREHGVDLAATYALAGQRDAAMRTLALAVRNRDPYLVGLRIDSRFAALRRSPDFQRLALSVGGG